ncbi:hypothetical protein [Halospeciosus flavus]|uniref:Tat (Twin-arginine translocation) pathway signal sequence n=1 Tax=Halospeciosus flavus TaxID=3032283 RepID=A0ABD5Z6Q8_9EURY|nr:hypothetical protein [Halospeciosus flavus]
MSRRSRSADATDSGLSRRDFGRGAGAAAVGAMGLLSGCTQGLTAAIGATLSVADTVAQASDLGNVNVVVTVRNTGAQAASAALWARLDAQGRRYEKEREITVPGGEEKAFTYTFDVTAEQFDVAAWLE